MSPEECLALATINPELEEIFKKNGIPDALDSSTNIPELRKSLLEAKRQLTIANTTAGETTYLEEDRKITARDGSSITVRIHSPKKPPRDGSPIFVVYHGGGFTLGGLDNESILCRNFTQLGGVAVNVDYRLAPENPFPIGIHDAYDALKWTAEHFEELGGNPKKGFLVGGISAGGNFGAVISHIYINDKLSPPLTGAYLSIPACVDPESVPDKYKHVYLSREQNAQAPLLGSSGCDLFESLYQAESGSPLKCPALFESHKGLPPTYFQICGLDPLRDEGLIYEQILRVDNGIKTKVHLYPGLPHGFWTWYPEAQFSVKFQEDCVEGMSWLLEQSKS